MLEELAEAILTITFMIIGALVMSAGFVFLGILIESYPVITVAIIVTAWILVAAWACSYVSKKAD